MELRSKMWHVWHGHLHIRKVKEKGYVPRGSGGDVMWYNVTSWLWFAGSRVFFRDVDVMDHSKSDMKTRAAGWSWNWVVTWGAFHTCFLKSDVFHDFHDFHEFHDFMIYESYDSWDEYNINYYLYLYTYIQMWCDALFCAPRCRDLGRGFDLAEMLELVRNFRPCRRGSPECETRFSHSTSEI